MRSVARSSQVLNYFSFHRLDKITHSSGGKYECVFLTEPEVKQSIEVKSKIINEYHTLKWLSVVISKFVSIFTIEI